MTFILKILIASSIISFGSWLSAKRPELAGFITALPLVSLIALAFSYKEWGNMESSYTYAKSIFIAVPLSLSFFIPFLVANKFDWSFWTTYILGIVLLIISFFIHKLLMGS